MHPRSSKQLLIITLHATTIIKVTPVPFQKQTPNSNHLNRPSYSKLIALNPSTILYAFTYALYEQLSNIRKTQSVTISSTQIGSALAPDLETNHVISASVSQRNRPHLSRYHRSRTVDPPLACRVTASSSEHTQPVLRP